MAETNNKTPERWNPTNLVEKSVNSLVEGGRLTLPADYSAGNALKSAWLMLQNVMTPDKRRALDVCTRESVTNALMDMVVQALNPAKKQLYFIPYGKELTCQRSYFGDMALAQRVQPGIEIYTGVVWNGDEFEMEMLRGRVIVARHRTSLANQGGKIVGAYCGVTAPTGEDLGAEVMTWEQIQKSWSKSKTYRSEGGNTPHHEFPDQMALRTVVRRRLKAIINSSNDSMLVEAVRRQERASTEAETDDIIEVEANSGPALELPEEGETEQEQAEEAAREPVAASAEEDPYA